MRSEVDTSGGWLLAGPFQPAQSIFDQVQSFLDRSQPIVTGWIRDAEVGLVGESTDEDSGALNSLENASLLQVLDRALHGAQRRIVSVEELLLRGDLGSYGGLPGDDPGGDVPRDPMPRGRRRRGHVPSLT